MSLLRRASAFFFATMSASGFGLMRIGWASVNLFYFLMQWKDVTDYYSDAGAIPNALSYIVLRDDYRYTLLTWITDPAAVFSLYLLLLLCLLLMAIGLWPRLMTTLSVILVFSFHERNPLTMGGGDTVLRLLGFLLLICPVVHAFSVRRAEAQWAEWRGTQRLLPPLTMPAWPYRMLVWQFLVIYLTSVWFKLLGDMWIAGTAVVSALHHPTFSRLPPFLMDFTAPFSPVMSYFAIVWQALWVLLLIPRQMRARFTPAWWRGRSLKRWLIAGGVFFHGSILVMMDAGDFSPALFVGYLGLLTDEDFAAFRASWRRRVGERVSVLYDGRCGLCRRSIFTVALCDVLRKVELVDFRDAVGKKRIAPKIAMETLDREMHVRLPDGSFVTGFEGFRALAWKLPPWWPLLPLLYVPGVPWAGKRVYAYATAHRHAMTGESCEM